MKELAIEHWPHEVRLFDKPQPSGKESEKTRREARKPLDPSEFSTWRILDRFFRGCRNFSTRRIFSTRRHSKDYSRGVEKFVGSKNVP